jgi:hypothetical protein
VVLRPVTLLETRREATDGVLPAAADAPSYAADSLPRTTPAATAAAAGVRFHRGGRHAAGAAPPGGDHAGYAVAPLLPLRGRVCSSVRRWKVRPSSLPLAWLRSDLSWHAKLVLL